MSEEEVIMEEENEDSGGDPVYGFAASPDGNTIFAGRPSGLYRSDDGGSSWRFTLDSLALSEPLPVVSVAVSPTYEHDRTILAGLPGGALRSSDGGSSWQILPFSPPPPFFTSLAFSPRFSQDGIIFGATAEDGFLRTANGGDAWSPWNFGLLDLEVLCLAVSPAFDQDETVFAGTASGLFRSTNGGRAWKELDLPCGHAPILSLAVFLSESGLLSIYAGTEDQGMYFSPDAGRNWSPIILPDGVVNGILLSQAGDSCLAVLLNSEILVSTNQGKDWRRIKPPQEAGPVSAFFAPHGLGLDRPLLLGLASGAIIRLDLLKDHLES